MDMMAEFVDVSTAVLTATIIPRLKAEGLLAELPGQPDTCVCVSTSHVLLMHKLTTQQVLAGRL